MAVWELSSEDHSYKALYSFVPAGLFHRQRWFADRGLQNEIELVNTIQFQRSNSTGSGITLNLFKTQPFAGYYYYLPFLITKIKDSHAELLFEKNGYYFYDAVSTHDYVSLIEELVQNRASCPTPQGTYHFQSYRNLSEPCFRLHGSTSNSLLFVSRNYLLKNYRRIYPGVNPELKVSAALTKLGSEQIPKVYGFFNFESQYDYTLGIIIETVDNLGTGWERWGRILEDCSPENETRLCGEAEQLGTVLGMLHRDLAIIAKEGGDYSELSHTDLEARIDRLEMELRRDLTGLLETDSILSKLIDVKQRLSKRNLGAKFRIHGDLHLEQIIKTADSWKILDFEGEPLKSIPERENCDSPLKDLASMLRSISYRLNGGELKRREIEMKISASFSEGYHQSCQEVNADFLPDLDAFEYLLTLFQIERAVYECLYESKYRPDWLWIPKSALAELVQS